jgi:hypothetical protein
MRVPISIPNPIMTIYMANQERAALWIILYKQQSSFVFAFLAC